MTFMVNASAVEVLSGISSDGTNAHWTASLVFRCLGGRVLAEAIDS